MHATMNDLEGKLGGALRGLTAEQTQARPAPGKWSVQQIVEHLLLSYGATCGVFETRLAKGAPTKAAATPSQRMGQFLITRLGWFPKGRKAPPAVTPSAVPERSLSGAELMERVRESLVPMDGLLARAEERFGARKRAVSHIVLGPMAVAQWRRFHQVHGEHHIGQIRAAVSRG